MVAEPVKEAVGVCSDAWRGKRDQGAERRRLTFQRHLDKQVAIHIGVERRIVFDQVARCLYRDRLAAPCNLQRQLYVRTHRRTNLDTLA